MSENTEAPVEGTEGGAQEIMRQVLSEGRRADRDDGNEDPRERVRRIMDRANNRNANRPEVPEVTPEQMLEAARSDMRKEHRLRPPDGSPEYGVVVAQLPPADDPSDPSKPVLGTVDLIEEIVATTQRYGAFAHWPKDKKAEALGFIERVVKQRAIAQQVVAVTRRDSVQARAYKERKRLIIEAKRLLKSYASPSMFLIGQFNEKSLEKDPVLYAEAITYLMRFARTIAEAPAVPGDEGETE